MGVYNLSTIRETREREQPVYPIILTKLLVLLPFIGKINTKKYRELTWNSSKSLVTTLSNKLELVSSTELHSHLVAYEIWILVLWQPPKADGFTSYCFPNWICKLLPISLKAQLMIALSLAYMAVVVQTNLARSNLRS